MAKRFSLWFANHRLAVIASVFFFTQVVMVFTTYHQPSWDEAVYLGMGKYLYSGGSSGLWENIRPIGWPVLTGFAWITGFNQIILSRLMMTVFATGCIMLTYLIAERAFNTRTAVYASILCVTTPIFFLNSSFLFTEIPSAFCVLCGVYLAMHRKYVASGLAGGLAFLFKFPQGIILGVLCICLMIEFILDKHRSLRPYAFSLFKLLVGSALVIVPLLLFNLSMYHTYGSSIDAIRMPFVRAAEHQTNIYQSVYFALKSTAWWAQLYNLFYYGVLLVQQQFVTLLFVIALFNYVRVRWYRDSAKNLVTLAALTYCLYLTAMLNKQERFLPLALPFVAMLSAYVFTAIVPPLKGVFSARKVKPVLSLLMIGLFVGSITLGIVSITRTWYLSPKTEPAIVAQVYRYFEVHNISGPIQTSDPVFSAYSDKKFIPVYDTMQPGTLFVNAWQSALRANAVVYVESAFPCFQEDTVCMGQRDAKFNDIKGDRQLIYNGTHEEIVFLIYGSA